MNYNLGNEDSDSFGAGAAYITGKTTNKDPYSTEYRQVERSHYDKSEDEAGNKKLAHGALYALMRSQLTAPLGYKDPNAPKRDRKELRKEQ